MKKEKKIGIVFTEFELKTIINVLESHSEKLFKENKHAEVELYNGLMSQLEAILYKETLARATDVKENVVAVDKKKESELNEDAYMMEQNLKGLTESAEIESVMVKNQSILNQMNKEYPETIDTFKLVNAMQLGLFAKKQADYGPGNISMNGNIPLALIGLGVRMNDKTQRILNLTYNKNEPNNESLKDSFMDISIYGIIAQILIEGAWGK